MKNSVFFTYFLIFLGTGIGLVQGQSCTTGCDIVVTDNSGGNIDVAADNQVICIQGSFTFNQGINYNNRPTTVCVSASSTFAPSFQNGIGGSGVTYNLFGSWNLGGGSVCSNCTINNFGVLTNFGTIDGTLNHQSTTPITVTNLNINGNGNLSIGASSTFTVTGAMTNNNILNIDGTLTINGSFTNNGSGEISNQGSLNVGGAFSNNGDMCSLTCGQVQVNGSFTNNGGGGLGADTDAGGADCGAINICILGGVANNGTTGSQTTIACPAAACPPPAPLPVRWLSFSLHAQAGGIVLDWQTTTEQNNDYFAIERSLDNQKFIEIGRIQGKGDTPGTHTYSFKDQEKPKSTAYYRLRQVDQDGRFSFSRVLAYHPEGAHGMRIHPHPIRDGRLRVYVPEHFTRLSVELWTMQGQRLWQTVAAPLRGQVIGTVKPTLRGCYLLKIIHGTEVLQQKVIFE